MMSRIHARFILFKLSTEEKDVIPKASEDIFGIAKGVSWS
jgi:hypothetical protein